MLAAVGARRSSFRASRSSSSQSLGVGSVPPQRSLQQLGEEFHFPGSFGSATSAAAAQQADVVDLRAPLLPGGLGAPAPAQRRFRRFLGPFEQFLDRIVHNIIRATHDGFPMRFADFNGWRSTALATSIRRRTLAAVVFFLLNVGISVALIVNGIVLYMSLDGERCRGPLGVWLALFLVMQFICPTLTVLLFSVTLLALLLPTTPGCKHVHGFLWSVLEGQLLQAVLLLVALAFLRSARPLVVDMGDAFALDFSDPRLLALLLSTSPVVAAGALRPEEECVICLARDDEAAEPWRQLPCGHSFHERCLSEWLHRSVRCPVCRRDLRSVGRGRPPGDS